MYLCIGCSAHSTRRRRPRSCRASWGRCGRRSRSRDRWARKHAHVAWHTWRARGVRPPGLSAKFLLLLIMTKKITRHFVVFILLLLLFNKILYFVMFCLFKLIKKTSGFLNENCVFFYTKFDLIYFLKTIKQCLNKKYMSLEINII